MHPLRRISGPPEASPCFLTQLHEELCQGAGVVGLLLQGIGVAEALARKIDGIDLVAAEPEIPVVAVDASEDRIFQEGQGSGEELQRREDAMGIQSRLEARIDAA